MIKIDLHQFRAVLHAGATKDVRYYLNGVNVRGKAGDNVVTIAATNGHILATAKTEQDHKLPHDVDFTIAIDDAKEIAKVNTGRRGLREVILPVQPSTVKTENTAVVNGKPLLFGIITDGNFPQYERIIADVKPIDSFAAVGFNPHYLALLDKMRAGLGIRAGHGQVNIMPTGGVNSAFTIVFDGHPDFLVMLMPCRVN